MSSPSLSGLRPFSLGLLVLLVGATTASAQALRLPQLYGKHPVGTVALELVDHNRQDPYDPSQPRDLMLSIFYPARQVRSYPFAPEASPALAEFYSVSLGGGGGTSALLNQTFASIQTQAHTGAPFDHRPCPPVLLFSPGLGSPRLVYSNLAASLASKGYVTVTIDHPHDGALIEYPDGRVIDDEKVSANDSTSLDVALDARRADVSFVIDRIQNGSIGDVIPGFPSSNHSLNASSVGVYGHSYGGATAAAVMINDTRAACGVNLDGAFHGPAIDQGTDRPFMIMSAVNHSRATDDTWATYWSHLTGFKLELSVDGTGHVSYGDIPALLDLIHANQTLRDQLNVGPIPGARMQTIMSAYIAAFFNRCLKGGRGQDEKLLTGPSPSFPEVHFYP